VLKPSEVSFATSDVTVYLAPAGSGKTTALMDEMVEM
jgi:ABC-type cobalamin/Fe3+-siderophores transport system ATPase subunit